MASKQTQNIQLCQWEPDDEVIRTDFNADNAKLDAAVAALRTEKADVSALNALSATVAGKADKVGLVQYAAGSYTGDGSPSGQFIQLGFTPEAVIVWPQDGAATVMYGAYPYIHGCMALAGVPSMISDNMLMQVVDGGFKVHRDGRHIGPNDNDKTYLYLAFHK